VRTLILVLITVGLAAPPALAQEAAGDPIVEKYGPGATVQVPYDPPTRTALTCTKPGTPKNVIYLVGDGMGPLQVYAGKAAAVGARGTSHIELCDYLAFATTYPAEGEITDSAAGATALFSAVKTRNGVVGQLPDGTPVPTLKDDAEALGKWTGIISNARLTHATPAAVYAHVEKRSMEDEIAAFLPESGIELAMGAGRDRFEPLLAEFEANGYRYVKDFDDLADMSLADGKLLALFSEGHLPPTAEASPRVSEMTKAAIELLSEAPNGFFLMVEGAMIDWAGHDNDAQGLINEQVDFDQAIGHALEFAEANGETLVIVTADHETGSTSVPYQRDSDKRVWLGFESTSHTGVFVPVAAAGVGATEFHGFFDNTDIPRIVRKLWNRSAD